MGKNRSPATEGDAPNGREPALFLKPASIPGSRLEPRQSLTFYVSFHAFKSSEGQRQENRVLITCHHLWHSLTFFLIVIFLLPLSCCFNAGSAITPHSKAARREPQVPPLAGRP